MTPDPLRILALWGDERSDDYFAETFLDQPRYQVERVSGEGATLRGLFALRRRIENNEFDLVLCSMVRKSAWPVHRTLATRLAHAGRFFAGGHDRLDSFWAPWLLRKKSIPLAVIDLLDTSYVELEDYRLLRAATAYFKLNLYPWPRRSLMPLEHFFGMRRVTTLTSKLRPMTLGLSPHAIPETVRPLRERDIDLLFIGPLDPVRDDAFPNLATDPIRQSLRERCAELQKRYRVHIEETTSTDAEYRELLQRAKLVLCTESRGCETSLLYEAAAAGAVPLSNWPCAQSHQPLLPEIHAIYFSMIADDFERTAARALDDLSKLETIAANARAFTLENKDRPRTGAWIVDETLRSRT